LRQRAAGTEAGAEIFTDRAGSRDVTGSVLSIALADGRPERLAGELQIGRHKPRVAFALG